MCFPVRLGLAVILKLYCIDMTHSSVGRQHTAPPLDMVPGSRAAQAHSEPAAQQSALLHGTHAQAL